MKKLLWAAASALAVSAACGPALSQDRPDALGKCLVDSSTGKDREAFMRWMFLALAANPSVKSMTNITADQRTDINKAAGAVMDRLILKDCRKDAVETMRSGGDGAFGRSFETFGRIAMTDLMSSSDVNAELSGLGQYLDKDGWTALGAEAAAPAKP